jgi:glycosyltransferase involved in cell wall biosynthesis
LNKTHQLQCAVVIATKNRLELLSQRAIPSIFKQTRQPDFLIVVDDSDSDVRSANQAIINSLQLPACRVVYLENSRTAGASGGWNTAIDYLFGIITDPSVLYLAFLDDDDSWMPAYLERCLDMAANQKLDMVAASIFRKEHINDNGFRQYAPEVLKAEDFLVGNPGIQGSNLFLNFSSLLAAGSFDESLSSSTDRDLCIRLADLGYLRYQSIKSILVNHFAEVGRLRLSTPTSKAKRNGLDAFWTKYASRMNVDQQMSFRKRSKLLFNWQPSPKLKIEENFKRHSKKEGKTLVLDSLLDCEKPNELDVIVGRDNKCKRSINTPLTADLFHF